METKYYLVYGTKISSYGTLENLSRRVDRRSYSDKKDVLDKKELSIASLLMITATSKLKFTEFEVKHEMCFEYCKELCSQSFRF